MFYNSPHDKPDLIDLSDFDLTITGPDGRSVPYFGLIEVTVKVDLYDLVIFDHVWPSEWRENRDEV